MSVKKATDEEILEAIKDSTIRKAAATLGMNPRTISKRLKRMRDKAGYGAPAPGYNVSGKSTLRDANGEMVMEWTKTQVDKEEQERILRELYEALIEKIPPAKSVTSPKALNCNPELINTYYLTDYHLGMYSWHEESGEDWDIQIAEDLLVAWFQQAIMTAPAAETCIFANLGDFLHIDSLAAVTPTSKHLLDTDGRFQLMIRVAIRVIRRVIAILLTKYKIVHVKMCTGNHDEASSAWFREMLAAMYSDELRVEIDTSADIYYAHEFGKVMQCFHHGHKRNVKNVDSVFVAKFREMYGRCNYHYGNIGHLHTEKVIESNLMIIEMHPTLCASDAYASHGGWMSHRGAKVITYHRNYGKVGENIIRPEMLK